MAEDEVVLKPPSEDDKPDELVSIESLQEDDDQNEEQEQEQKQKEPFLTKKKIIIFAGIGIFILLLIVILIVVLSKKDKKQNFDTNQLVKQIEQNYPTKDFEASKIDDMISKANELYERGDKFQALKIYENIATQSQSLSSYNLGVSQMKQGKCDEAIESFLKAIHNKENTTVSAINAAVCSLDLNNTQNFKYYIDLAESFLQDESNSPLYNYYYALINYYKGNYIEALHALSHPSGDHYKDKYLYLSGKILTMLGRYKEAIQKLESQKEFDVNLTLSQLYARLAIYDKARQYLEKASKNTTNPDFLRMTGALIDLKTGYYANSATLIDEVYKIDKTLPGKIYKIKTILNPELFDINIAQKHFENDMFFDKVKRYETLFYFAPYKVFDAKQTIQRIRKGGINIFLDDTTSANDYLQNTQLLSSVNIELSNAIANALNFKLKESNMDFIKLVSIYPKHSILHYNLALTYAQLGNFSMAFKHFATSYHLDPTNYLAGVFHAICADITNNLNPKFISELSKNLRNDTNIQRPNIYNSLLDLIAQNQSSMIRYLEESKDESTLNLAFEIIIAKMSSRDEVMKEKTAKLLELMPNDIVSNILNFIANYDTDDIKTYALNIQKYFKNKDLNEDSFYNGASIIKKQYTKLLQISGLLFYERDKIIQKLKNAPSNVNLLQTLAYMQLFTNEFDKSFEIYNILIDNFKVEDPSTLFLASVAATGANKSANAIALLELTRISDPDAIENRIALGFLYQEIDNIKAAMLQYSRVGNTDHKNEFYDFSIINNQ
ncbi:paralysed flagella protein B [Campylobacter pinnipediorum subsp. pinnipediorum]|uniref:tetratricopeptide repeat protein n=1 Tax=Campylobacter pinnipediorum TaxID=1965231 RepID=UPI000995A783|nr:CDC27 family protein [Campylobacter pinnipediorum]AQW80471.1 paralysed flagella protein B [Campylobacter pinnipediorum subsp. pinnipediorum]